jgi:hypothetical protein
VTSWRSTFRVDPTARVVARLRLCRATCKTWTRKVTPCVQRETDCRLLINLLDFLEESRPPSALSHHGCSSCLH